MSHLIRRAVEEDHPEMSRLWREMMDFHACQDTRFRPKPSPEAEMVWTRYLRQDILPSDRWCAFVAEEEGQLIGQILGELRKTVPVFESDRYGYVTDIVVDPRARRRGIGRALFGALRTWFAEHGASHLELRVLDNNRISQAFWRAMGFTDCAHMLYCDLDAN